MSSDVAVEAEQIRNALVKAGVSPHLVIMDCCSVGRHQQLFDTSFNLLAAF